MPPDHEVLRKVAQWLTYGDEGMRLLELCPREEGWLGTLEDAKGLTPFAITLRYPGAEETVTREEALRAIEVAARVRQVVRDALARAGVHLGEEPPS